MKKILFTLTVLGCSVRVFACDACGCSGSLGNMGLGIQSHGNRTSFSFVNSYKIYTTAIDGLYGHPDTRSQEAYYKSDITATVRLSKRFQARATIPFVYNSRVQETNSRTTSSGLGDVWATVNVFLIDSAYSREKTLRWSIGLGAKLPTGTFTAPESEGFMLNPGTGTVDYLLTSSFAFRTGRFALSNESSFSLRTTNNYDYHPGNTWFNQTIGLFLFNRISVGTGFSMTRNEQAKLSGAFYSHTNSQALLIQSASVVAFSAKAWSFQLSVNLPIYQQLGEGNSEQKTAVSLALYYVLKQKK